MKANDPAHEHYRTLGLHCDASAAEVRDAYYRMVFSHHPDRNQGDSYAAARFKKIQFAYEWLCERRVAAKPREIDQFPFIAPTKPRVGFSWHWLTAVIAAAALAALLLAFGREKILVASAPALESVANSQTSGDSRAAAPLLEASRSVFADDDDLNEAPFFFVFDPYTDFMSRSADLATALTDTIQNTLESASAEEPSELGPLAAAQKRAIPVEKGPSNSPDSEEHSAALADLESATDREEKHVAHKYHTQTPAFRAIGDHQWVSDIQPIPKTQNYASIPDFKPINETSHRTALPDWGQTKFPRKRPLDLQSHHATRIGTGLPDFGLKGFDTKPTGFQSPLSVNLPTKSLALPNPAISLDVSRMHQPAQLDHPVTSKSWGKSLPSKLQLKVEPQQRKTLSEMNGLWTKNTNLPSRSDGVLSAPSFSRKNVSSPEKILLPATYGSNNWVPQPTGQPMEKFRLPPAKPRTIDYHTEWSLR
ncbi:J domain-containing protein [Bythopirellula goksoeyrii]|uniref:Chaperone protein DnaJ n=1 Tax=Bythopirellula goksoeyrii TaxID=1400387 RepID=A0A5B9QIU4_9BACT|nr:J domain-containing protein [Bythopirellula goksoeyrii]QEG34101.1 Chaperone protein DnaJ [Bythopirellula goksoeyrii]